MSSCRLLSGYAYSAQYLLRTRPTYPIGLGMSMTGTHGILFNLTSFDYVASLATVETFDMSDLITFTWDCHTYQ